MTNISNIRNLLPTIAILLMAMIFTAPSFATDYHFNPVGGNVNWNHTANWSPSYPGVAIQAADRVYIHGSCDVSNLNIINLGSMYLLGNYTGPGFLFMQFLGNATLTNGNTGGVSGTIELKGNAGTEFGDQSEFHNYSNYIITQWGGLRARDAGKIYNYTPATIDCRIFFGADPGSGAVGGGIFLWDAYSQLINTGIVKVNGGQLYNNGIISTTNGSLTTTNGTTIEGSGSYNGAMTNYGSMNYTGQISGNYDNYGNLVMNGNITGNVVNYGFIDGSGNYHGSFFNNGNLTGGSNFYSGIGTELSVFQNSGGISPGHSPGKIRIEMPFETVTGPDKNPTLSMELGGYTQGSGYDWLEITEAATLAGKLTVSIYDNFQPAPGSEFTIITAGAITGFFSQVHFVGFNGDITYNTNSVVIKVRSVSARKPGSGSALSFDAASGQYVELGTNMDQGDSFTFETWARRSRLDGADADNSETLICSKDNGGFGVGFIPSTGRLYLTKVGVSNVQSSESILDTKWHHIAVTYDIENHLVTFYIDGVQAGSTTFNFGGFNAVGGIYQLAGRNYGGHANYLNGSMDEVRIWDIALSQEQVRERICRKIKSDDVLYTNLVAYYNFDEGVGETITDLSPQNHSGTLKNSPSWVISGAYLGDRSSYSYDGWEISLDASEGESLEVTGISGSPTGLHIYIVNEKPASTTGIEGIGTNNRYFGVYHFGGDEVSYQATYHYEGNEMVTEASEPGLKLYFRTGNESNTWTDSQAERDQDTKTLVTVQTGTEYMLGSTSGPLPVSLVSFDVRKNETNQVSLEWSTTQETNSDYFEIQHSADGIRWQDLAHISSQKQSQTLHRYNYTHASPVNGLNYYRLKMVDQDRSFDYSRIRSISIGIDTNPVTVFPNPVSERLFIRLDREMVSEIKIINPAGAMIYNTTTLPDAGIDLTGLSTGIYFVKIKTAGSVLTKKIVVTR